MIRSSALYLVIIIALVIGLICSFVIIAAYIFRQNSLQHNRYQLLTNNLGSATNILLSSADTAYIEEQHLSLFGGMNDSIKLKRTFWGGWDVNVAVAYAGNDSLYHSFFSANQLDSARWYALYLKDQDSPLSVSGESLINGDAALPESGIRDAYVDNKKYTGEKKMVSGTILLSKKTLPKLDSSRMERLRHLLEDNYGQVIALPVDTVHVSFFNDTKVFDLRNKFVILAKTSLSGNILIKSDTTIIIDSTARLDHVILYAKKIIVRSGFKGNCQLYAKDGLLIEKNCKFTYPSLLAVTRFSPPEVVYQPTLIKLDSNVVFDGYLFNYEKEGGDLKPQIEIGKNTSIRGSIYSQGNLFCTGAVKVSGSVYAANISYKSPSTFYRNYLVDARLDSKDLTSKYLVSPFLPYHLKNKYILQWLEKN